MRYAHNELIGDLQLFRIPDDTKVAVSVTFDVSSGFRWIKGFVITLQHNVVLT